jgi:hypothetical protein
MIINILELIGQENFMIDYVEIRLEINKILEENRENIEKNLL